MDGRYSFLLFPTSNMDKGCISSLTWLEIKAERERDNVRWQKKKSERVVQRNHLRPKGRGFGLFALYNVNVVYVHWGSFDFDFVDLSESNTQPF